VVPMALPPFHLFKLRASFSLSYRRAPQKAARPMAGSSVSSKRKCRNGQREDPDARQS
jgi:hypothetical protein